MPITLEGCIVRVSDVIAYVNHDIDDALRAGVLKEGEIPAHLIRTLGKYHASRIDRMVEDVIGTALSGIAAIEPKSAGDIRSADRAVVVFSPAMREAVDETRRFLFERVYRNESIMQVMRTAEGIVDALFERLMARPDLMPGDWSRDANRLPADKLARRVSDYLSGMTDTFAMAEHRRLFDVTPQLR